MGRVFLLALHFTLQGMHSVCRVVALGDWQQGVGCAHSSHLVQSAMLQATLKLATADLQLRLLVACQKLHELGTLDALELLSAARLLLQ